MITFEPVQTHRQVETVAALAAPIWHETYDEINGVASTDYMIEKFQSVPAIYNQMEREGYVYFMALADGVPAGFVGLVPHKDGKLFLSKLYVAKAFRGKGIPRAAITLAEETARRENLPAVYLTVNKKNTHAIEVYKSFGFYEIDAVVTDIGRGFVMNDYVLQKDLV